MPTVLFAQHHVNGTFSPAEEFTYAFLYHATATGSEYINRAKLEADGGFSIPLDSMSSAGIYKIVYGLPPEENNFDFIYNGEEDISFTFSLTEGLEFTDSNENKLWSSYTKSMELVNMTISNFYTKESTDISGFEEIFKTLKDTQEAFEAASKGAMANVFISANRPYIPIEFEDISTYAKNLKRTYLQNVDFSNPLLQSSEFLVDRVLAYVFGMTSQIDEKASIVDIDTLMTSIGDGNIQIKTILLKMIWLRFTQQNKEDVANYISNTYLLELAQQTENKELENELIVYRTNSNGMQAHDFDFAITTKGETERKTLHELDVAEQYLIIFWSSSCGHCLEELPSITEFLKSKPNLKVIAIGLEDTAERWEKEIANFPDFIHVLGLQKWENSIAIQYGVNSTPSYFLLNKDKIIIAKPYDAEALKKTLE